MGADPEAYRLGRLQEEVRPYRVHPWVRQDDQLQDHWDDQLRDHQYHRVHRDGPLDHRDDHRDALVEKDDDHPDREAEEWGDQKPKRDGAVVAEWERHLLRLVA